MQKISKESFQNMLTKSYSEQAIRIFVIIAIALSACLVYLNSLHGEFHLDDEGVITTNRSIHSLKSAISTPYERPIAALSFALNYHFGELNTFGYHLVNLIIHILTAVLVFLLIEFTLRLPLFKERFADFSLQIAALAALIFAVHPVHSESVSYLTQRMESLCALFYLGTLVSFILSIHYPRYKIPLFSTAIISLLLAMGTKEVATTAPLLILIYDFLLVAGKDLRELKKRWLIHSLIFSTLTFRIYLTIANIDVYGKTAGFGMPFVNPLNYLFTQFTVVLYYIKLIFQPFPLNLDYDWPYAKGLFEFPTFLSFLVLIAIFTITLRLLKRQPLYAFLLIWYFLILAPSSSLIPLKDVIFEHRVYLASVGIIWLSVLGIVPCLRSNAILFKAFPLRYLALCLVYLIIPLFGLLTIQRNNVWQSEISLWEDTVRKSPRKPRPHLNLGTAYKRAKIFDQALLEFSESFRVDPTYARGESNLGVVYYELGKIDAALKHLKAACDKDPGLPEIHFNLGVFYDEQGKKYEAIQAYKRAIDLNPDYYNAYYNLGEIYLKAGRTEEAIGIYKKVLSFTPDLATAHANLGALYSQKGMFVEAERELIEAIRLTPNEFLPHFNLAITYERTGRIEAAINEYKIACNIQPNSFEAHNSLANLYKTIGLFDEAIKEIQALIELNPMNGQNMLNLLRTKQQKEHWDKIWEQFQEAIKANPQDESAYINFARTCVNLGMLTKAKQVLYSLLEMNPNSYEAHLNMGLIFGREGDLQMSIHALKKAISINPEDARAYYNLAVSFERLSMPAMAEEQYKKTLEIVPNHESARINLGILLAKENKVEEAIAQFEQAQEINPNSSQIQMNLGALYKTKSDFNQAEKKLKKAIELNPNYARAHFHLALLYFDQGRLEQAKQEHQLLERIDANLASELTKFGFTP